MTRRILVLALLAPLLLVPAASARPVYYDAYPPAVIDFHIANGTVFECGAQDRNTFYCMHGGKNGQLFRESMKKNSVGTVQKLGMLYTYTDLLTARVFSLYTQSDAALDGTTDALTCHAPTSVT